MRLSPAVDVDVDAEGEVAAEEEEVETEVEEDGEEVFSLSAFMFSSSILMVLPVGGREWRRGE